MLKSWHSPDADVSDVLSSESTLEILAEVLYPHFATNSELKDFRDGAAYRPHPLFSTDRKCVTSHCLLR